MLAERAVTLWSLALAVGLGVLARPASSPARVQRVDIGALTEELRSERLELERKLAEVESQPPRWICHLPSEKQRADDRARLEKARAELARVERERARVQRELTEARSRSPSR